MNRTGTESYVRLGIGVALDLCLWPLISAAGTWSSYEREGWILLMAGAVAAAVIVLVLPLFWRGEAWQAAVGFVLLWLPVLAFFQVGAALLELM